VLKAVFHQTSSVAKHLLKIVVLRNSGLRVPMPVLQLVLQLQMMMASLKIPRSSRTKPLVVLTGKDLDGHQLDNILLN